MHWNIHVFEGQLWLRLQSGFQRLLRQGIVSDETDQEAASLSSSSWLQCRQPANRTATVLDTDIICEDAGVPRSKWFGRIHIEAEHQGLECVSYNFIRSVYEGHERCISWKRCLMMPYHVYTFIPWLYSSFRPALPPTIHSTLLSNDVCRTFHNTSSWISQSTWSVSASSPSTSHSTVLMPVHIQTMSCQSAWSWAPTVSCLTIVGLFWPPTLECCWLAHCMCFWV